MLGAHDLQEALASHCALQASALLMFDGVAIGDAFPVGPVGAEPQVLRTASFGAPLFGPLLLPVFDPVLLPVLEELLDPVAAPVGFEAVGTTVGTEVHALS